MLKADLCLNRHIYSAIGYLSGPIVITRSHPPLAAPLYRETLTWPIINRHEAPVQTDSFNLLLITISNYCEWTKEGWKQPSQLLWGQSRLPHNKWKRLAVPAELWDAYICEGPHILLLFFSAIEAPALWTHSLAKYCLQINTDCHPSVALKLQLPACPKSL